MARRLASDAQLDHHEVRPLEGGVRVGRRRERPAPAPLPEDAFGESTDDLASEVARIEQDEVVDDHPVLNVAQAVDELRGVRAPAAHDNHLGPHAAQRNIRPCPNLPTPYRRCWRSTGGSTKTDVLLVSRLGDVLGRARVGASNHQLVGLEGTVQALTEAVAAVSADAGVAGAAAPLCPVGVYCLAGIDLSVDEEKLAPAIDALGWTERIILRNDTFAVSRSGTTSRWGIGVVCGTGMNCAAIGPDGRTVRFPALAELSGDFAPGGAWLGLRALGLALRAGDGRGPATTFANACRPISGRPTRKPR